MGRNVRFLGFQYPLIKTPKGIFAQKSEVDQIKADLLQLLLTNPNERVMMPDFGVPLRRYIFEQLDTSLLMELRQIIIDAIQQWEPRIEIKDISVLEGNEQEGEGNSVYITIEFYDPGDISKVESLVLEVPLAGDTPLTGESN